MEVRVSLISVSPGGVLDNRGDDNVIHLFSFTQINTFIFPVETERRKTCLLE